jgi:hypothetical protein
VTHVVLTLLAQSAPAGPLVAVDGQTVIGFFVILLALFGVAFRMIMNESTIRTAFRDEYVDSREKDRVAFAEFKALVTTELRLMQAKQERASHVGVRNALEVLGDDMNPWTKEEREIKRRMYHNPDFQGIEADEIEMIIRRLDEEVQSKTLQGDKLMAAHYMLRELNGELAKRLAEYELRQAS